MFVYRIEKYIGAYQAAMNGLDAVIFTAGIGENNPWIMKRIKKDLKNVVSRKVKFMIIPTDEELYHLGFEKWQVSMMRKLPVDLQWEAHDEFIRRLMSDEDVEHLRF